MARLRLRYMSRKNKLLFEIGVGLVLIILFLGFLNAVTTTSYNKIVATEDVYSAGTITYWYKNATSGSVTFETFNVSDVATMYNDALYITVPEKSGYDRVYFVSIKLGNKTWGELVDRGFNRVEYMLYVKNATAYTGALEYSKYVSLDKSYYGGSKILELTTYSDVTEFYTLFGVNETTRTVDVDTGALAVTVVSNNAQSNNVYLGVWLPGEPPSNYEYIKLKITLYAVSEKPVLAALTEPMYSVIATMYTAIWAVARRVKQYASTLFGGFFTHFSLTALIGDPVIALVLSIVFLTVVFMTMKKR